MGKVNLGLLHHEDLTDFIWLSSLGASHPRRFFCCRESESGEEDLHLQLHLRLKWGPSQREEQPGQLRNHRRDELRLDRCCLLWNWLCPGRLPRRLRKGDCGQAMD